MTSSNGNIFRVTGPLCGEFTGDRWIPRTKAMWRGALMSSLICAWINGWVNNREAGYSRRHRAHYDVIVIEEPCVIKMSVILISLFLLLVPAPSVFIRKCAYVIRSYVHGWYSSFRIPNINNRHDHVTFVEKCPILWLATSFLASNHNKHDDIGVLHQCMTKWVNETQQNADKCHI